MVGGSERSHFAESLFDELFVIRHLLHRVLQKPSALVQDAVDGSMNLFGPFG